MGLGELQKRWIEEGRRRGEERGELYYDERDINEIYNEEIRFLCNALSTDNLTVSFTTLKDITGESLFFLRNDPRFDGMMAYDALGQ